jgi:hypothetical protein
MDMAELSRWIPTITTAGMIIGIGFVADSSIKRHEALITGLVSKVQSLETKVAVLEATKRE